MNGQLIQNSSACLTNASINVLSVSFSWLWKTDYTGIAIEIIFLLGDNLKVLAEFTPVIKSIANDNAQCDSGVIQTDF